MVSRAVEPGEEFVLLLANHGNGIGDPNSFYTHLASMDRRTVVSLLSEYLVGLKQELGRQS